MSRLNYINLFRSKHPDLSDAEIKSHCKLMNIELGMLVDVMATRLSVIKNPSDYDPDDFERATRHYAHVLTLIAETWKEDKNLIVKLGEVILEDMKQDHSDIKDYLRLRSETNNN